MMTGVSAVRKKLASRFAVIGAGKMAEAMVGGMMSSGMQPASDVSVFDTNVERTDIFATKWGVTVASDAAACVRDADLVLLSVKPQHMPGVLESLKTALPPSALAVSIAAGCTIRMFTEALPTSTVVRSMPNTPSMIGMGMTVWTATPSCSPAQLAQAKGLLGCFGDEIHVADELYLDMATALVGSGPAFTLLFMEAMIDAGVHMGFPRDTAKRLVQRTVEGSAALVAQASKRHIAALRNDITSPGGTTAAAIYSCDQGGFRTTVADAIWAAYRRSLELGGEDSRVGPGRSKI